MVPLSVHFFLGSSPHTRGAPHPPTSPTALAGIIPAYAGSTSVSYRGFDGVWGSSPHTRGAPATWIAVFISPRIIPAYAGSTCLRCSRRARLADHPRIRGEHGGCQAILVDSDGSSPHTRGAPIRDLLLPRNRRIIPAYAGSTTMTLSPPTQHGDHPRIRGEHGSSSATTIWSTGSSPHTRGAPPEDVDSLEDVEDHPRIRGEHTAALIGPAIAGWIIPAYAGSTLGNPCNTKDRRRDYTSFPLPVTHPSGGGGS